MLARSSKKTLRKPANVPDRPQAQPLVPTALSFDKPKRRRTLANEAEQENESTAQAVDGPSSALIIIIEQCTEQHRTAVLRWLHDEYVDSGCGFWANHKVIEESPLTDMFVAVSHGEPTAFALLEKEGIDSLCTRTTRQWRGIGRTLARVIIEELWCRGLQAITILCSPPESFGWQRSGFERVWRILTFHSTLVCTAASVSIIRSMKQLLRWSSSAAAESHVSSRWGRGNANATGS